MALSDCWLSLLLNDLLLTAGSLFASMRESRLLHTWQTITDEENTESSEQSASQTKSRHIDAGSSEQ